MSVVLWCLLAAFGMTLFTQARTKSPSAISRFLNHKQWSLRTLIRAMRNHALEAFREYLCGRHGRPPAIEIIVDTTSIAEEGEFSLLDDWIHTLNGVHGLHLVVLYICCGDLRTPWSFRIWYGKDTPSPNDLALTLVRQVPLDSHARTRHLHFLTDSGFNSINLLKGLNVLGLRFTVDMRRNRLTADGQALSEFTSQERKVQLQCLT